MKSQSHIFKYMHQLNVYNVVGLQVHHGVAPILCRMS